MFLRSTAAAAAALGSGVVTYKIASTADDRPHRPGILSAIGNTPLVDINSLSKATGCRILAKMENLNPGGSVKDRAALFLVEQAEKKGGLKPGGTIVEGTGGNTGIGLAVVARAKGYKAIFAMPQSVVS